VRWRERAGVNLEFIPNERSCPGVCARGFLAIEGSRQIGSEARCLPLQDTDGDRLELSEPKLLGAIEASRRLIEVLPFESGRGLHDFGRCQTATAAAPLFLVYGWWFQLAAC